jgi:N-glycosylase/DNA lyase
MTDGLERGALPLSECPGGLDLQATLESGQSYCWWRADRRTYDAGTAGDDGWYETVVDGELLRAKQTGKELRWEATTDAVPLLRGLLRLDDDLDAIRATAADDDVVQAAYDNYWGLRIVADPFFPCLISFICSAQMHVSRIFGMQMALRERYGEEVVVDGETYHGFPAPGALAAASEEELRELNLGYRAPYVKRTAEMVAEGELTEADAAGLAYPAVREELTGFVGVGQKVADCVCLFSLSCLGAVPLDTWMHTAIEEHFPECEKGNYADTSEAFRERLGGEYAGYTQTYLFHHLRNEE